MSERPSGAQGLARENEGQYVAAVRKGLEKWYGAARAASIRHAEAFELCEYGYQPTEAEMKKLLPMLGK